MKVTLASSLLVFVFAACKPGSPTSENAKSTGNESTSSGAGGSSSLSSTAEPVVYVNSDSLASKCDYYKEVKENLETKEKSLSGDIERRGKELENDIKTYQSNAVNLTPNQKQATEAKLAKKQQNLQAYQQSLSQQIGQEAAEVNQKLYSKLQTYLKDYCTKNHHKVVLTYVNGGNLLYGDQTLDVTSDVVKGLNDAFKIEKAGK